MNNKIYKIILLLLYFNNFLYSNDVGYQKSLDRDRKYGSYKSTYLELEQIIIDIIEIDTKKDLDLNNKKVRELFNDGEKLWLKYVNGGNIHLISQFKYKNLCDATINYYMRTNQIYKSLEIYNKLILESKKYDFMEIEFITLSKYLDTSLTLGLVELSEKLITDMKSIIDDFFIIDMLNIDENDMYSVAIFSEYKEDKLRYEIIVNNKFKTSLLNSEFDFLLEYYKYNYMSPFLDLTSRITTKEMFEIVSSKNNIADKFYYLNYKIMFLYAKIFAINGDISRANKALDEAIKALKNNASNLNSIYTKELHSNVKLASNNFFVIERVPLKYDYLSYLYSADINYHIGKIKEARRYIEKAEQKFKLLIEEYKKLPAEYEYIDGIMKSKRELLTLKANILEKQKYYVKACDVYDELIVSNEEIRRSLPLKLRKSYFRGYAKDAYLGLIRSRAKIYEKEKTKESFDNFLIALNLLSSRQLKDLKDTSNLQEQNLEQLQTFMSSEDLIYIIYDVESDIVIAGISKSKIFISIVPKNETIDKELYEIKNDLVQRQIYDKEKLLNISSSFINPIREFKNIKKIHLLIDGIISVLPFDIYPIKDKIIFDEYRVDYLTFLNFSNVDKKPINMNFLAIADPLYDDNGVNRLVDDSFSQTRSADISGYFVRLPETRREVEVISKKMKSFKLLLGEEAKESIIKTMLLEKYNYIHFATHGILGGEIPDMNEPALVLAKEDTEDSLLSASEIAKLKLNASLVVLSACNTGSGKYFRGEGITGIARAFKIAGSDEIIASLWPVDSAATEKLMEYFYDNIAKGSSNSEALHLAKKQLQINNVVGKNIQRGLQKKDSKKEVVTQYYNPYFWSAFILIR